jgi:hypothetical protein
MIINPFIIMIILIVFSGSVLIIKNLYLKKHDICDETKNDYIDNKCIPKCPLGQIRCNDICYDPDKYKCIDNKYTCMLCNPGDTECCKNETCSVDPLNPDKKICCSELQKCSVTDSSGSQKTICCGAGSICQNNKCVVVCGKKKDGSDNICDDTTQICSIISNVDPEKNSSLYKSLKNSENNLESENPDKTSNFYSCRNKNPTVPTDNRPFSAPSSINNQYPCFNIPKTDTETGLGFCSNKSINVSTSINDRNIIKCKKNGNKVSCENDNDCKWYDVLKYNKDNIQNLNLAISKTFNSGSGLYCGNQGQRIIGYTYENKDSPDSMNSCFNTFINNATSDIDYDPSTGSCVSLLKCGSSDKSNINLYNLTTEENKLVKNKIENIIPVKFSQNDFYMPSCGNKTTTDNICNPNIPNSFTYGTNLSCLEDGTLNVKTLNCVRENTDFNVVSPPGINCSCKKGSNGLYLYGGKNCEINPDVYCNRNAKYFSINEFNTDNPSCVCINNTSSESRCTKYNLIDTTKISFSEANRIWSIWHTASETFNMVIYVYPGLNSSISVKYGYLRDTRTTYFSEYEKYTLYFIDQSPLYGPEVTLTIWNDTNPDVKYNYNIQQDFWSAFYPRPDLNIKSSNYSQTWSWTDSNGPTLSNNPSIFNGAGRSYKPECSNNRVYACFAAQIYVSMPII